MQSADHHVDPSSVLRYRHQQHCLQTRFLKAGGHALKGVFLDTCLVLLHRVCLEATARHGAAPMHCAHPLRVPARACLEERANSLLQQAPHHR